MIHAMTGFGPPSGNQTVVAGGDDPFVGETPEEEEAGQERKHQHEVERRLEQATGDPTLEPGKADVPVPPGAGPSVVPLRVIHPDSTYETDPKAKRSLEFWRNQPTNSIIESFVEKSYGPLLVRRDGAVLNGNTRVKVLQERGYPVDDLPRMYVDPKY